MHCNYILGVSYICKYFYKYYIYYVFFEAIENCFKSSFPEKKIISANKSKPFSPWMTEAWIISKKNRFFNKNRVNPALKLKWDLKITIKFIPD